MVELEDDNEPEDNQQGGDDVDENLYLDCGKLLVIQRSLHTDF